jgi:hypothetical protein
MARERYGSRGLLNKRINNREKMRHGWDELAGPRRLNRACGLGGG